MSLLRLALARLALAALVAWGAYALAWALAEAAPAGAAERAARAGGVLPPDDASSREVRAALIARAEARFGLGGGGPARVARAARAFARGDLGASWRDGTAVGDRVAVAAADTARLALPALCLAFAVGAAVGIARASRRGWALPVASALALALPPAWLAQGAVGLGGGAALAAAVLALAPAAMVAAHVAAALAGFLASPAALAARARGVGARRLAWVHGLRVALPGLAALAPLVGGYVLGVSAVVERAFALPGLGRVALDAAAVGDVPVLAAVAALAGGAVSLLSGVADVAARRADPRLEAT